MTTPENKLIPDTENPQPKRGFDLGIPDDCIEKRSYAPIPGTFDNADNYMVEPRKEGFLRRLFRRIFGK